MKIPCAMIRDLLPLYAEKMVEQETENLVNEHLAECSECRQACFTTEPSGLRNSVPEGTLLFI